MSLIVEVLIAWTDQTWGLSEITVNTTDETYAKRTARKQVEQILEEGGREYALTTIYSVRQGDDWDTDEVENWMLNDESIYRMSKQMTSVYMMRLLFVQLKQDNPDMRFDIRKVNWKQVVATRKESE